jgi:2-polyprenyl-3-methyl-5-hydroxy-6-metoxy-1,4-benzoquinol methylase
MELSFPVMERYDPLVVCSEGTKAHHRARYAFATASFPSGHYVLDLGCGVGYGSEMLRRAGLEVVGVDLSEEAVMKARERHPAIRFLHGSIDRVAHLGPFDMITFFEVIEHMTFDEGEGLLESMCDILKPGGHLLLSTPVDAKVGYNPWHVCEWSYKRLREELGKRFDHVTILGQDWRTELISSDISDSHFYVAMAIKDPHSS